MIKMDGERLSHAGERLKYFMWQYHSNLIYRELHIIVDASVVDSDRNAINRIICY